MRSVAVDCGCVPASRMRFLRAKVHPHRAFPIPVGTGARGAPRGAATGGGRNANVHLMKCLSSILDYVIAASMARTLRSAVASWEPGA